MNAERKGTTKKIISLILPLALIIVTVSLIFSYTATAAESENGYIYETEIYEGTTVALITGYMGEGGHITIPETLGGYPVVGIDNYAFSVYDPYSKTYPTESYNIESIVIPDGVIFIGEGAFLRMGMNMPYDVQPLDKPEIEVTVPSSVKYIGSDAFGCITLKSLFKPVQTVFYEGTEEQWKEICDDGEPAEKLSVEIKVGEITFTLESYEEVELHCFSSDDEDEADHIPGDINGDGIVNNKDLNRLMKYLAGDNVEVNESALDVNGDSTVNNKDLNRLMKYLAGDEVEIY